jgi:hypothetical protein
MIYKIGIVEDNKSDINKVDRILYSNLGEVFELEPYSIENISSQDEFQETINKIVDDANGNKIHGLILDYKIMVQHIIGKGNEIFTKIKENIPLFPVIILTERVEETREDSNMDFDKIYRKEIFFTPESKESQDQSMNFFKNIEKYYENKKSLEQQLKMVQEEELENEGQGISDKAILKMIELEEQLSQYEKDERSNLDKFLNPDKLSKALDIINKLNEGESWKR